MAKSFRVRQISYQWVSLIVVLALAIVWLCLDRENYWGSVGIDVGPALEPHPDKGQRGCMAPPGIYGRGAFSRHIETDLPQKSVEEPANRVATYQGTCHPRPERPEGFHRCHEGGEPDDGIRRRID